MEFYEVPRSLLEALGSKTFRTSALTTLSTTTFLGSGPPRYTNILFLFLFKILLAAAAHRGTAKKFLRAARCYPMDPYEVLRSLLGALGSKTFRTSALTTLSTTTTLTAITEKRPPKRGTQTFYFYFYSKSCWRQRPTEVHKHSIQNPGE